MEGFAERSRKFIKEFQEEVFTGYCGKYSKVRIFFSILLAITNCVVGKFFFLSFFSFPFLNKLFCLTCYIEFFLDKTTFIKHSISYFYIIHNVFNIQYSSIRQLFEQFFCIYSYLRFEKRANFSRAINC